MGSSPSIAVVGRGLIGSAAARHLAMAGHDVTLIGPGEPATRSVHKGVFGSHYDEGRITRLLDPHPVWADAAKASIARYRDIEQTSGIRFYHERGLLSGAPEGSPYLAKLRNIRDEGGIAATEYTGEALKAAFPYLQFDPGTVMLHQRENAGHISPRQMVLAQTKAAKLHGAKILDDFVLDISGRSVRTNSETMTFDKIIVAAGVHSKWLVKEPLDLRVYARTITFFELEPDEAARLAAMPSIIFRVPDNSDPYVLPPIRYPDGKTYLKIGGEPVDRELNSEAALRDWYRTAGDETLGPYMIARTEALLPGLSYASTHTESCALTYTASEVPYIAPVRDDLYIATGGCGGAAKSADELGRIAANTVLGTIDERFPLQYEKELQS